MAQEVICGTTINHKMNFDIFDFHGQELEWCGTHGLSIIGGMVQDFRFRVQIRFRFRFRFRFGFRIRIRIRIRFGMDHMDLQF